MPRDAQGPAAGGELRERIIRVAAALVRKGGRAALTTRAVEAAAGVQAPTIYRLFGDKHGLIGAVAEHEITDYVARKRGLIDDDAARDPVEVLADAWRTNVQFGLDNPDLFWLMHDAPATTGMSEAMRQGEEILRARVRRLAQCGRLAVSEDRAVQLIIASATGATLTLIVAPEEHRDLGMLDDMLAGLLVAITHDPAPASPPNAVSAASAAAASAAVALRAAIRGAQVPLSPGEAALLEELLLRLVGVVGPAGPAGDDLEAQVKSP